MMIGMREAGGFYMYVFLIKSVAKRSSSTYHSSEEKVSFSVIFQPW